MFEVVVDNWETEVVVERRKRKSVALQTAKSLATVKKADGSHVYASVTVRNRTQVVFYQDNTP